MRWSRRWWWFIPVVILLVAVGGFLIWAYTPAAPMLEAELALVSDPEVTVETEPWILFRPAARPPAAGLIFYPGGRVDPRAYAPPARMIAAEGYLVVVVPMPLNLAVIDAAAAEDVIAAFPEVHAWTVGGHSLGGAMAAQFAYEHPDAVDGLVLWAAYPPGGADLSGRGLVVTSIYGTLDGLAPPDEVLAARPLLPPGTAWVPIEGGNHAQFGSYGPQSGDNDAAITREMQQAQAVAATVELLRAIAPN